MALIQFDTGFRFDAASADDDVRLHGPATGSPPTEWSTASPHVINEPWHPDEADLGPPVEEWTDASHPGSHTSDPDWPGYSAPTTPNRSWKFDTELPAGVYTTVKKLKPKKAGG